MNNNYTIGDFVMLKETSKHISTLGKYRVNIFQIVNINNDEVKLSDFEQPINIDEVQAVPINGEDDAKIYFAPIVMADFIIDGKQPPARKKDYSYYIEGFKTMHFENSTETLYDKVMSQNFKYVHEVQHFLRELFQRDELRINYFDFN